MSAHASLTALSQIPFDPANTCKIVVFYENTPARAKAMEVCDRLVNQFGEDIDFEFGWWKFCRLADPVLARHATNAATSADIVIFCPDQQHLDPIASEWMDEWVQSVQNAEGALALVCGGRNSTSNATGRLILRFEQASKQLGMDFILLTPPETSPAKTALDSTTVSSTPVPPRVVAEPSHTYHWGLNE